MNLRTKEKTRDEGSQERDNKSFTSSECCCLPPSATWSRGTSKETNPIWIIIIINSQIRVKVQTQLVGDQQHEGLQGCIGFQDLMKFSNVNGLHQQAGLAGTVWLLESIESNTFTEGGHEETLIKSHYQFNDDEMNNTWKENEYRYTGLSEELI